MPEKSNGHALDKVLAGGRIHHAREEKEQRFRGQCPPASAEAILKTELEEGRRKEK